MQDEKTTQDTPVEAPATTEETTTEDTTATEDVATDNTATEGSEEATTEGEK